MKVSMNFEGGDELARALNTLSTRISRRILTEALIEGGEPIRARAAEKAPREPGAPDLAENINIGAVRRQADQDEQETTVGIGVPRAFYYDWFQEMGTVRMGARPFYRPAFDTEAPKALGVIGQALWRELAGRGIGRTVTAPTSVQSDRGGPFGGRGEQS